MDENSRRVELLYIKHKTWLAKVAFNICRDKTEFGSRSRS